MNHQIHSPAGVHSSISVGEGVNSCCLGFGTKRFSASSCCCWCMLSEWQKLAISAGYILDMETTSTSSIGRPDPTESQNHLDTLSLRTSSDGLSNTHPEEWRLGGKKRRDNYHGFSFLSENSKQKQNHI